MAIGLLAAEQQALRTPLGFQDDVQDTVSAREVSAAIRLRQLQQQQTQRRSESELAAPASILALFG